MDSGCNCAGRHSDPGHSHTAGLIEETAPAQPSFYRRQLPTPPAIEFASEEGRVIFTEALASGGMSGFFPLIAQFQTQAEPAYCGLASLSVALNALSIDPGRSWKGPWRWFDEALLDCCEPLEKIKREGIMFGKLVCLARCNGAAVKSVLASHGSENEFREDVRRASGEGGRNVIVGYSRRAFLQTGDGHFSPIGGYHAARDLVLILDVARFKYPPHWVPLPLLWQAMQHIDKVTGDSRGYLVLSSRAQPSAALFSLARPDSRWWAVANYGTTGIPDLLQSTAVETGEQALEAVLEKLPCDVTHLVTWMRAVAPAGESVLVPREGQVVQAVQDQVLRQLRSLKIHRLVSSWVARHPEGTLDTRADSKLPSRNGSNEEAQARQTSNDNVSAAQSEEPRGNSAVEKRGTPSEKRLRSPELDSEGAAKRARQEVTSSGEMLDALRVRNHAEADIGLRSEVRDWQTLQESAGKLERSCCASGKENAGSLEGEGLPDENVPTADGPTRVDLLAVLLLICPSEVWASARDPVAREELQSLTNTCCLQSPLYSEIVYLKEQYAALRSDVRNNRLVDQSQIPD